MTILPPSEVYKSCKNPIFIKEGKKLLTHGQIGTVILSGGHGSRLGINKPKGTIPVTSDGKKSLFQLFIEKASKAQNEYEAFKKADAAP